MVSSHPRLVASTRGIMLEVLGFPPRAVLSLTYTMALAMSGWKILTLDIHVVHPPTQLSVFGEGVPALSSVHTVPPVLPPVSLPRVILLPSTDSLLL